MIIVSQNKEQIVNFDNIEIIFLKQKEAWYQGIYGEGYQLAEYKTEKRAQEVLQEIVGLYRRCQQVIRERGGIANFIYPPKVYEMPKE